MFKAIKIVTLLLYAVVIGWLLYDLQGLPQADWDYCDQYTSCYEEGCCQQAIAERNATQHTQENNDR